MEENTTNYAFVVVDPSSGGVHSKTTVIGGYFANARTLTVMKPVQQTCNTVADEETTVFDYIDSVVERFSPSKVVVVLIVENTMGFTAKKLDRLRSSTHELDDYFVLRTPSNNKHGVCTSRRDRARYGARTNKMIKAGTVIYPTAYEFAAWGMITTDSTQDIIYAFNMLCFFASELTTPDSPYAPQLVTFKQLVDARS